MLEAHAKERIVNRLWRAEVSAIPTFQRTMTVGSEKIDLNANRVCRDPREGPLLIRDQRVVDDGLGMEFEGRATF